MHDVYTHDHDVDYLVFIMILSALPVFNTHIY